MTQVTVSREWVLADRALHEISRGFDTCSLLGEQLWSKKGRHRMPQHYARPAGRLIARMHKSGLVFHREWVEGQRHGQMWRLTPEGRSRLDALLDSCPIEEDSK